MVKDVLSEIVQGRLYKMALNAQTERTTWRLVWKIRLFWNTSTNFTGKTGVERHQSDNRSGDVRIVGEKRRGKKYADEDTGDAA